ncbi:MAG: phytoene/squalene synthase family protein [Pyrobaculum sp.]
MSSRHYSLFRVGRNFYLSSVLFPRRVRDEVAILYAYVRYVDDLVDCPTPKVDLFYRVWRALESAARGGPAPPIIAEFVDLAHRRGFQWRDVEAFMESMEMDLYIREYDTYTQLLKYVYGSAEVIGLFMARILSLPKSADPYARLLGRAYQLINMARDVAEDAALGRRYIPEEFLKKAGAGGVAPTEEFATALRLFLKKYYEARLAAEAGYRYIPRPYLRAIKTASDIYDATAWTIWRRPLVVFERKVRPHWGYVAGLWLKNWLLP